MGFINENSTNNRMFTPGRYSNNKNKSFNNNNYYHGIEQFNKIILMIQEDSIITTNQKLENQLCVTHVNK